MSLPSDKKRKIFDGRYEVMAIVGRGLDSVVYQARHLTGSQQEVALKVLINNKPKSSLTERLRKEALTLVSCRHKYVIRLDDFHSVADLCYLSMEFAPFGDLRKYVSAKGAPLPPELGEAFLRQALEGLDFVHATGVLHRDIKPDNILVINDKEIRLADFGLALLPGDEIDLKELQNGVGSLDYLPPEMLDGERYDSRSDLYSLGVCFYEAMAGFHPFQSAPLSEQKSVREERRIKPLSEINPAIPENVSAVVASLMRYFAENRFQTATDALRALSNPDFMGTDSTEVGLIGSADTPLSNDESEQLPQYTPANSDQTEGGFTTDFDDFFKDYETATAAPEGVAQAPIEPSPTPTEEISPQRVQELINNTAADRTTTSGEPTNSYPGAFVPLENALETDFEDDLHSQEYLRAFRADRPIRSQSILSVILGASPFSRPLLVGVVAAFVTIAVVLVSNVRSSETQTETTPTPQDSSDESGVANPVASEEGAFPHVSSGTYAGNIQGFLPGVTSPLALISRPEHNELTVIIGVEGWSPITISTLDGGETPSSTIVVRSNGVLLNMTGTISPEEITGTFSNAITGESGVWRVRRSS